MPAPVKSGSKSPLMPEHVSSLARAAREQIESKEGSNIFSQIFNKSVNEPIDMDWEEEGKGIISRASKKRTLDEANLPSAVSTYSIHYGYGSDAKTQLEVSNILLELPDDIKAILGGYTSLGERLVMLNAYLQQHLLLLSESDQLEVINTPGDNFAKFQTLKSKLERKYRVQLK